MSSSDSGQHAIGEGAPGLARPDRERGSSFSDLLRRAAHDPHVAESFVLAWASMDRAGRRGLVDAIRSDGRKRAVDVGKILGILRCIEKDPWVFDGVEGEAWVGTQDGVERLVLVQEGQALEVRCTDRAREIEVHHHPVWASNEDLRAADLSPTVDRIAELLWQHRRDGGRWPGEAGSFAALFDR